MAKRKTPEHWRNAIVRYADEDPASLLANPQNWRIHPREQTAALTGSLTELGWIAPVIVNETTQHVVDGHARIGEAIARNEPTVPVAYVRLTEDQERIALATFDPISAMAGTDQAMLDELLSGLQAEDQRLVQFLATLRSADEQAPPGEDRPSLSDRFLVPPFSVLDARQGYWQERKRYWLSLGIESELGRGVLLTSPGEQVTSPGLNYYRDQNNNGLLGFSQQARSHYAVPSGSLRDAATLGPNGKTARGDGKGAPLAETFATGVARGTPGGMVQGMVRESSRRSADQRSNLNHAPPRPDCPVGTGTENMASGTSIFDPVLCELAYRWFSPPGGAILDPFAGGSVRGIIASRLGRRYSGVDLSGRQLDANRAQAAHICPDLQPAWIEGDSRAVASLAPGDYDLIFSCPPYADLERYSDDPADLSTMAYPDFLTAYRAIVAASVDMLCPDRFACFVVGDVRDKRGIYRNFVSDTIAAFQDSGAMLYNEAILVTAVGSLPIRVGKQFSSGRKLGKTHQNVLVFIKGDPRKATAACGPVEVALPDEDATAVLGDFHDAASALV